ncbi:MAG: hypothetical protein NZ561_10700, partial [Phycisphaerae bacterium]|nr:hypothetical protein [Phycisphaerae bacterium]
MIRSRLAVWVVTAGAAALLTGQGENSWGATDIPPSIVSSPEAEKSRDVIRAFIREQVAALMGDDAAARAAARDALTGKAASAQASVSFLDIYLTELAPELIRALRDPKLPTRLNAAIVASRAGSTTIDRQGRLAPVVEVALADNQLPVLIWSMKAAAQQLP